MKMMNCERAKELLADYLVGSGDEGARAEMESHLAGCASCREETASLEALWTKLAALPEEKPSSAQDARFHAMLEAYRQGMSQAQRDRSPRVRLADRLARLWPRQPALQFALAVLLFALGLVIGPSLGHLQPRDLGGATTNNHALARLREEVAGMKQLVTLSLLQQQSASERLRGVEWSYRLGHADEQVLSALLSALDSDPNVNVRLAAVDALQQFARSGFVKQGLLDSLPRQSSPLVQIELINLLVELKERESVPVLKALLQNNELNDAVRQRAEWGLQQLG